MDIPVGDWAEILERAEAEEEGASVPLESFLDRLRASIARMETGQTKGRLRPAREA